MTGTTVKPVENLLEDKEEVDGKKPITSRSEEHIHKDKVRFCCSLSILFMIMTGTNAG